MKAWFGEAYRLLLREKEELKILVLVINDKSNYIRVILL